MLFIIYQDDYYFLMLDRIDLTKYGYLFYALDELCY